MGNYDPRTIKFRQSLTDFPITVALGRTTPSFGLHRYKEGLQFIPPDDEGFVLRGDKQRLVYKGKRRSHRYTILDDGSFEYDCILNREPETNFISLLLDGAEHYDFFRQPDFVKDPFLKGSLAVYKKETMIDEGTGKLCHIHRPLIIDARGRRVWGELLVVGNELRIVIPEWWLAEAKYPVVVDPVVGTTTIGAHYGFYDEDYEEPYWDDEEGEWVEPDNIFFPFIIESSVALNRFTITQDLLGNVTAYVYLFLHPSRDMWGKNYMSNENDTLQPCLYKDVNNIPVNKISSNEGYFDDEVNTTNKPPGWRTAQFSTNQTINAGDNIWFGINCRIFQPRFDYGAKCYVCWDDDYDYRFYHPPPDICPVWNNWSEQPYLESLDIIISTYFNYTPMQHYVRTLTQGIKLLDSRSIIGNYKRNVTDDTAVHSVLGIFGTFFRKCAMTVYSAMTLVRLPFFFRNVIEQVPIASHFSLFCSMLRKCIDDVMINTITGRIHHALRKVHDLMNVLDRQSYSVLLIRSVADNITISQQNTHWGDFVRNLLVNAESVAETSQKSEYYRYQNDKVQAVTVIVRGLLLFVRIVSGVFIRDYLLRRFLVAKDELKIKSCICRDLFIESRID